MKYFNYLFIILIIFLINNCSKSITEPEVEDVIWAYRVVSYNSIPIEEMPEYHIMPLEIRLFNYKVGEVIVANIRLSVFGWFESKFNSSDEIYIEVEIYDDNLTLFNLIITETNMAGEYYWGFTEKDKVKFVAVKK